VTIALRHPKPFPLLGLSMALIDGFVRDGIGT